MSDITCESVLEKVLTCIVEVENSERDCWEDAGKVQKYCGGYRFMKSLLPYKAVVEIREVERYSLFQVLEQALASELVLNNVIFNTPSTKLD